MNRFKRPCNPIFPSNPVPDVPAPDYDICKSKFRIDPIRRAHPICSFPEPHYEQCDGHDEWHDVITITYGELLDDGFITWGENGWIFDAYNNEQFSRLTDKITARYYWREIGIIPPGEWKQQFIRILNEIMPKYKLAYEVLENGIDILQSRDEYGKSRDIYSDFPETMLSGNSDYASTGADREHENISNGDPIDQIVKTASTYNDVDVMILDELEQLFSCLFTVNLNGLF